jgi:hypothetical protein
MFAALALTGVPHSSAQDRMEWEPVPLPSAFYSPTSGFGLGVGWNVRNVALPQDDGRIRARAQQYRQSVSLGWASSPPTGAESGFALVLKGYRNLRESFYGTGPGALKSDEQVLQRNEVLGEFRFRWRLTPVLWIQPRVEFRLGKLASFRPEANSPPEGNAVTNLEQLRRYGRVTGTSLGVDAGWTFGAGHRAQFHFTTRRYSQSVRQTTGGVLVEGSVPVGAASRIEARFSLDRTFSRSEFLPYYLQPRLDDRLAPGWDRFRFYGNDRFVLGVTYIWPLVSILKSHVVQGVAAVTIAQVYDDVRKQFSARVAVAPDRSALDGRVPLEPTFALGWELVSLRKGTASAQVTVGVSAEGLVTTGFRIRQDLSDWYSAIR